jgi:hypothetical protein
MASLSGFHWVDRSRGERDVCARTCVAGEKRHSDPPGTAAWTGPDARPQSGTESDAAEPESRALALDSSSAATAPGPGSTGELARASALLGRCHPHPSGAAYSSDAIPLSTPNGGLPLGLYIADGVMF